MKLISAIVLVHFSNAIVGSLPRNCDDVKALTERRGGNLTSGVYTIHPGETMSEKKVFCDMETDGGGWIVIQRRREEENQINFLRNWTDYSNGFGGLQDSFWLGLETISILTNTIPYKLRIDMMDWDGEEQYAVYEYFRVANATENYKLTVEGFNGNAGDSLMYHSGKPFSTYDNDNDDWEYNCASGNHGAWWYSACHYSNLNGLYGSTDYANGVIWRTWLGNYYSLKQVEMKIRPAI